MRARDPFRPIAALALATLLIVPSCGDESPPPAPDRAPPAPSAPGRDPGRPAEPERYASDGAYTGAGGASTSSRLHVLLICVDTLRADRLGAYGYAPPTSPHLDRFAAGAHLFENARAQAPCTFPSANSLLTSRYPSAFLGQPQRAIGIPAGIPSLAELLAPRGWSTAAVSASPVVRATRGKQNPHGG